jgi:similar to spore coat protein
MDQSGQGMNQTQAGQGMSQSGSTGSGQMSAMTEQVIATDLLMAAKSGIKNYATAIAECATPELRQVLTEQLNDAIRTHEQITNYMVNKGYYHPVDVLEQLRLDEQAAQTAMNLQQ